MESFKRYDTIVEARPYSLGEDVTLVSISITDRMAGSPKLGDMIARDPESRILWLVSESDFEKNFEPARLRLAEMRYVVKVN